MEVEKLCSTLAILFLFRWKVNHRGSYAFVEFVEERDAEDAKMVLNNKNLGGLSVNIEWSKRSGNYNPKESIRN